MERFFARLLVDLILVVDAALLRVAMLPSVSAGRLAQKAPGHHGPGQPFTPDASPHAMRGHYRTFFVGFKGATDGLRMAGRRAGIQRRLVLRREAEAVLI